MFKILIFSIGVLMSLMADETIVFGAGCFWGVEKSFSHIKGVKDVVSGYAGGEYENPTYKEVLKHRQSDKIKNYAEVVKVIYDEKIVSTKTLIEHFFSIHNPTQKDGQGNDIGNNYRSAIFTTNKNQEYTALALRDIYQEYLYQKLILNKITTQIKPLEKFYKAEEYHQNYLEKNPNGYCPNHSTGAYFKNDEKEQKSFYKNYAKYKLGENSLAYKIAYNAKTEAPFCQKYDKFKNTTKGVFVDIISGDVLFKSDDRFNSHSGWLSFYYPVKGNVVYKEDNSLGMKRVEVIAKKSGAHLGHVFDDVRDSRDGKKRYCINANVLEFVADK